MVMVLCSVLTDYTTLAHVQSLKTGLRMLLSMYVLCVCTMTVFMSYSCVYLLFVRLPSMATISVLEHVRRSS